MTTSLLLQESARLVRPEELAKASTNEYGLFEREIRRMQEYDAEVCPERFKPLIERLKTKPGEVIDALELLRDFGTREFNLNPQAWSEIAQASNHLARATELTQRVNIYDISYETDNNNYRHLIPCSRITKEPAKELVKEGMVGSRERVRGLIRFTLKDKIEGFKLLFAEAELNPAPDINTKSARLMGMLEEESTSRHYPEEIPVYKLGEISLNGDFEGLKRRRFMYAFGTEPSSGDEILKTLVRLNHLPGPGTTRIRGGKEYSIQYGLELRTIGELNAPRSARLVYDEALKAKERGLFADVQVYELTMTEIQMPKKDPVIVGIDSFGQIHPLIYWAGDEV